MRVADAFEKIRINPGNYVDGAKKFDELELSEEAMKIAKEEIREVFGHPASQMHLPVCCVSLLTLPPFAFRVSLRWLRNASLWAVQCALEPTTALCPTGFFPGLFASQFLSAIEE